MKNWKVIITFVGLCGSYVVEQNVLAKNEKSAETKARKIVGNRDCLSVEVVG